MSTKRIKFDSEVTTSPSINQSFFGRTPDGKVVQRFDIDNGCGMKASFISYGATLISLQSPDRNGCTSELTLQRPNLKEITERSRYFGSTIGRVANRICGGKFVLDGVEYLLSQNNLGNSLHGGKKGFDKQIWEGIPFVEEDAAGIRFDYFSPANEEGYPGNLQVSVTYTITTSNCLHMHFRAVTDAATIVNLTNHTYWNLSGDFEKDITSHYLSLNCNYFLPVNDTLIPTGELASVEGTLFNFTEDVLLGERINEIVSGGVNGLDNCFAVNHNIQNGNLSITGRHKERLTLIAVVKEPHSGRIMRVYGTQPGVQIYTGNFLSENPEDAPFIKHNTICLETQHFPDAINQSNFETTILRPGEIYEHETCHVFGTDII